VHRHKAEIIPEEPDADNAAVGRIYTCGLPYSFFVAKQCNFWYFALSVIVSFGSGKDIRMTGKTNTAKNLHSLCEAAIFIALATVFALLTFPPFRIDLWVFGGSIDFVMLPLFIMCWRLPAKFSIPACFVFGIIKFLITGNMSPFGGIIAILFDYILAYGMVGVAAFFRKMKGGFFIGIAVGSVARFIVHFISGITIYNIALGDTRTIFGLTFTSNTAGVYSLLYNGSFMLGELIFCMILGGLLYYPLKRLPKIH